MNKLRQWGKKLSRSGSKKPEEDALPSPGLATKPTGRPNAPELPRPPQSSPAVRQSSAPPALPVPDPGNGRPTKLAGKNMVANVLYAGLPTSGEGRLVPGQLLYEATPARAPEPLVQQSQRLPLYSIPNKPAPGDHSSRAAAPPQETPPLGIYSIAGDRRSGGQHLPQSSVVAAGRRSSRGSSPDSDAPLGVYETHVGDAYQEDYTVVKDRSAASPTHPTSGDGRGITAPHLYRNLGPDGQPLGATGGAVYQNVRAVTDDVAPAEPRNGERGWDMFESALATVRTVKLYRREEAPGSWDDRAGETLRNWGCATCMLHYARGEPGSATGG